MKKMVKRKRNKCLFLLSCSITFSFATFLSISCSSNKEIIIEPIIPIPTDQEIVNNYIKSLTPSIKAEKINEKANTFARDINTEKLAKLWFNNLPISNNDITSSFISSMPKDNDEQVLVIKYDIFKNNYHQTYIFEESGFKKEVIEPTEPSNPNEMINFSISVKRSNGKKLPIYPTIEIYDKNNTFIDSKWFIDTNLPWEFQLKNDVYKVKVEEMNNNVTWSYQSEYIIDEKNNNLDIVFTTNKLYNEDIPKGFVQYNLNTGIYKTEFTDVLGNKLSLADNCQNNKITFFIFFKTTCPYCKNLLNTITSVYNDIEFQNKFEVWLFSSVDHNNVLKSFAQNDYPQFNIVEDSNFNFRKLFINPNNISVPETIVVDSEGIYIENFPGETKLQMIQNILRNLI